MTIKTHEHSLYLKGYWHQPVMLQYVQSIKMRTIDRLTRHEIGTTVDRFNRIYLLVACWFRVNLHTTSTGIPKIPIENSITERYRLHPAVSSLEACPMPAH